MDFNTRFLDGHPNECQAYINFSTPNEFKEKVRLYTHELIELSICYDNNIEHMDLHDVVLPETLRKLNIRNREKCIVTLPYNLPPIVCINLDNIHLLHLCAF